MPEKDKKTAFEEGIKSLDEIQKKIVRRSDWKAESSLLDKLLQLKKILIELNEKEKELTTQVHELKNQDIRKQKEGEKTKDNSDKNKEQLAKAKEESQKTKEELEKTKVKLGKIEEESAQTKELLETTIVKLATTEKESAQTKELLEKTQEELKEIRKKLEDTQKELQATIDELNRAKEQLTDTKTEVSVDTKKHSHRNHHFDKSKSSSAPSSPKSRRHASKSHPNSSNESSNANSPVPSSPKASSPIAGSPKSSSPIVGSPNAQSIFYSTPLSSPKSSQRHSLTIVSRTESVKKIEKQQQVISKLNSLSISKEEIQAPPSASALTQTLQQGAPSKTSVTSSAANLNVNTETINPFAEKLQTEKVQKKTRRHSSPMPSLLFKTPPKNPATTTETKTEHIELDSLGKTGPEKRESNVRIGNQKR